VSKRRKIRLRKALKPRDKASSKMERVTSKIPPRRKVASNKPANSQAVNSQAVNSQAVNSQAVNSQAVRQPVAKSLTLPRLKTLAINLRLRDKMEPPSVQTAAGHHGRPGQLMRAAAIL